MATSDNSSARRVPSRIPVAVGIAREDGTETTQNTTRASSTSEASRTPRLGNTIQMSTLQRRGRVIRRRQPHVMADQTNSSTTTGPAANPIMDGNNNDPISEVPDDAGPLSGTQPAPSNLNTEEASTAQSSSVPSTDPQTWIQNPEVLSDQLQPLLIVAIAKIRPVLTTIHAAHVASRLPAGAAADAMAVRILTSLPREAQPWEARSIQGYLRVSEDLFCPQNFSSVWQEIIRREDIMALLRQDDPPQPTARAASPEPSYRIVPPSSQDPVQPDRQVEHQLVEINISRQPSTLPCFCDEDLIRLTLKDVLEGFNKTQAPSTAAENGSRGRSSSWSSSVRSDEEFECTPLVLGSPLVPLATDAANTSENPDLQLSTLTSEGPTVSDTQVADEVIPTEEVPSRGQETQSNPEVQQTFQEARRRYRGILPAVFEDEAAKQQAIEGTNYDLRSSRAGGKRPIGLLASRLALESEATQASVVLSSVTPTTTAGRGAVLPGSRRRKDRLWAFLRCPPLDRLTTTRRGTRQNLKGGPALPVISVIGIGPAKKTATSLRKPGETVATSQRRAAESLAAAASRGSAEGEHEAPVTRSRIPRGRGGRLFRGFEKVFRCMFPKDA